MLCILTVRGYTVHSISFCSNGTPSLVPVDKGCCVGFVRSLCVAVLISAGRAQLGSAAGFPQCPVLFHRPTLAAPAVITDVRRESRVYVFYQLDTGIGFLFNSLGSVSGCSKFLLRR